MCRVQTLPSTTLKTLQNKFTSKTKRNSNLKESRKISQEKVQPEDSSKNNGQNYKNYKSLKYNPGALKAMLVEKLHKRYDIPKDTIPRKTTDRTDGLSTQRHFRNSSMKNLKINDKQQSVAKHFSKRRRSKPT